MSYTIEKKLKTVKINVFPSQRNDHIIKMILDEDEPGIIYKMTAVLLVYGWEIFEAIAETTEDRKIQDCFIVRSMIKAEMAGDMLDAIRKDMCSLLNREISIMEYLEANFLESFESYDSLREKSKFEKMKIDIFNPESIDCTVLDIRALDRPGLLFEITQILYAMSIDIVSMKALTDDGKIRDSFLLRKETGERITDTEFISCLKEGLEYRLG